jgi:hypothetical protein
MTGEEGAIYVRFGPGLTQVMPLDWAEKMLSEWKDKQPVAFGKYLAEAALNAK